MGLSKIEKINKLVSLGYSELQIKEYFDNQLQRAKESNQICKEYWIKKGYSEEEAENNIKLIQRTRSKRCKEYWIKKGYSEEEAKEQVSKQQYKNGYNRNHRDIDYLRSVSPRCKEYWIKKGYSEEEAKEQVSKNVWKNNLESNIKKYGLSLGTIKYNNFVKRMKYTNSFQYFLDKCEGDIKTAETLFSKKNGFKNKRYSKISQELFWEIYNQLNQKEHIYFGELNREFGTYDTNNKRYYWYDFVDTIHKKCIEFNGIYFHAKPEIYSNIINECNNSNKIQVIKDIWNYDKEKINWIKSLGYNVKIIWEDDYKHNKMNVINNCLAWLKNE